MRALLIVDLQKDFCPGGALGVRDGDKLVEVINRIIPQFDLVYASKDWHPEETVHFEKWPRHCVRESEGASFSAGLAVEQVDAVLLKGTDNRDDGYSAFEATNHSFDSLLREKGVEQLYVVGIATDYCVKATVLDALSFGFTTYVVTDGVAAVNLAPEDGTKALEEMVRHGAIMVDSAKLASH